MRNSKQTGNSRLRMSTRLVLAVAAATDLMCVTAGIAGEAQVIVSRDVPHRVAYRSTLPSERVSGADMNPFEAQSTLPVDNDGHSLGLPPERQVKDATVAGVRAGVTSPETGTTAWSVKPEGTAAAGRSTRTMSIRAISGSASSAFGISTLGKALGTTGGARGGTLKGLGGTITGTLGASLGGGIGR